MPSTLSKPRRVALQHAHAGSGAAAQDRRHPGAPFTGPVLARPGAWERLTRNQQRLLTLIENQPRECGVSVLNVGRACAVLHLRAVDIVRLLDELNALKVLFFYSFDINADGRSGGNEFYALKPHGQHGDLPMSVSRRLAERFERERGGRA